MLIFKRQSNVKVMKFSYKPPRNIRPLFIVHYAPLILIMLIGPATPIFGVWGIPMPLIPTILAGAVIFFFGSLFFIKWEIFWEKTYKGQLVTTGYFKYIRHPHYASLLAIGFGLSLFFYSMLALLISIIAIPIMVCSILDEEKELIAVYGDEYRNYMKRVPWRLVPGLF